VILPYESHGYRARASILHVLAEMFAWADRWAGRSVSDASGIAAG
jgi:dipeptidyl aminopeptidase/acylaminoacyl peptidase